MNKTNNITTNQVVIPLKLNVPTSSDYDFTYSMIRYGSYSDIYDAFMYNSKRAYYVYKKPFIFLIDNNYIYDTINQTYIAVKHNDNIYLNTKVKSKRRVLYKKILESLVNVIETNEIENFIVHLNDISFKSVRQKKTMLENFKIYLSGKKDNKEDIEKEETQESFIVEP